MTSRVADLPVSLEPLQKKFLLQIKDILKTFSLSAHYTRASTSTRGCCSQNKMKWVKSDLAAEG